MEVLFKTQHGSHLYGLAHAESDEDWFTVVTKKDGTTAHTRKRYARQSIVDGVDTTVVDFGTWLIGCEKGVPQFLEAMFSRTPEIDRIAEFRSSFRVSTGVYDTYFRTMKSFAMSDTFKSRRHSLRLALNLMDIRDHGYFDPTLNPLARNLVTGAAKQLTAEETYSVGKSWVWS